MTRTTPEMAPPLQTSTPHQRTSGHYVELSVQQAPYTADVQWNRVSSLEFFGPKAETLPPLRPPRPQAYEELCIRNNYVPQTYQ
ncbi:hypothetical protein AVEN_38316-1 [Araneus ventricosus]|uniref:Uncharacterized protein n=1 Tax=Araneus ventricosus TaxID=182803 RepID=A0A4Y2PRK7_ARAVE|nr:hypothetical protein AVEN_38316-1 [Araneus ventricosus]